MPSRSRVRLDLSPLRRLRADVRALSHGGGTGPLADFVYRQWPQIDLDFQRRRYLANNRGGGEWPPLSPVTIGNRADKGAGGILIETRTLYSALIPGRPGNLIRRRAGRPGSEVGIGGGSHPGGLSIGAIAEFHNSGGFFGNARVPARPPMALLPDDVGRQQMLAAAARALRLQVARLPRVRR